MHYVIKCIAKLTLDGDYIATSDTKDKWNEKLLSRPFETRTNNK